MSHLLRTSLLSTGMLASLCACAQPSPPAVGSPSYPEQVTLAGKVFKLENQQQSCTLRKPDQSTLSLEIPWPCHFSIGSDGKAHVETFENVPIVMVLHVVPTADDPLECRSQYRAIRLIKGQPELSVIARSASCLRGAGDQKDYTAVFNW